MVSKYPACSLHEPIDKSIEKNFTAVVTIATSVKSLPKTMSRARWESRYVCVSYFMNESLRWNGIHVRPIPFASLSLSLLFSYVASPVVSQFPLFSSFIRRADRVFSRKEDSRHSLPQKPQVHRQVVVLSARFTSRASLLRSKEFHWWQRMNDAVAIGNHSASHSR